MSIDVALFAVVGRDPERKTSHAGRPNLRVNARCGNGDSAQWLTLMIFNDVEEFAARLKKDSRIYAEGTLTAEAWIDRDGKARPNLSVMTFNCVETHRIGRNKERRERSEARSATAAQRREPTKRSVLPDPDLNDRIPF
jgi:single-stranded DNA-binding protein